MVVKDIIEAFEVFQKAVKEEIKEARRDDYAIFSITSLGNKYCITYKREYYKNFGHHFKTRDGWGQVANKKLLVRCANTNYRFVMVMPDGKVYEIDPKEWLKYHAEHRTDVPHLEGEIAIPLKMFKRLGE